MALLSLALRPAVHRRPPIMRKAFDGCHLPGIRIRRHTRELRLLHTGARRPGTPGAATATDNINAANALTVVINGSPGIFNGPVGVINVPNGVLGAVNVLTAVNVL